MSKGKVIGAAAAAVAVPAVVVVGAIYILPALGISSSNTLYYFGNDTSISADGTIYTSCLYFGSAFCTFHRRINLSWILHNCSSTLQWSLVPLPPEPV